MFEVFNMVTGNTVTYCKTREYANTLALMYRACDYWLAPTGYYILRNGMLNNRRFDTREEAERHCDFENMASDYSTYTCTYWGCPKGEEARRLLGMD